MHPTVSALFVIQIDSKGIPGCLTPVTSEESGIDLLQNMATEQEVEIDRDTLLSDNGFFVHPDRNDDVTGCWLIAAEACYHDEWYEKEWS